MGLADLKYYSWASGHYMFDLLLQSEWLGKAEIYRNLPNEKSVNYNLIN